jgi:hypothetical protein
MKESRTISWTPEEEETLRQVWPTTKTRLIVNILPRHKRMAIHHRARKLGLKKDARHSGRRVYQPIWKFWDEWSPDLAYVIGLLAADGTVMNTSSHYQHGVKLVLKQSDEHILQQIKELAGGSIHPSKTVNAMGWRLNGNDVAARLKELGLVPNKTFRQSVPYIPTEYRHHFVRGYFDGDGCISQSQKTETAHAAYQWSLAGNRRFLCGIKRLLIAGIPHLRAYLRARPIKKFNGKNIYTFAIYKRSAIVKVVKWIYSDANLHLIRKKRIADRWVAEWGHLRG